MGSIKEINIKDRTYYFYNDIIDIKTFDSKNLKLDKKNVQRPWYSQYWICYSFFLKKMVIVMMLIM